MTIIWHKENVSYLKQIYVRVLQRNRIGVIYLYEEISVGIGSCGYRGWEVLQSAICKLENQESWGRPSVQVRKPENWGAAGVSSGVWRHENWELRCLRTREGGHPSSRRERICPASTFLSYLGPHRIGWCPHTLVRVDLFTQSIDANANLLKTPSQTHPEIVLPVVWASLTQSSWHIKLTVATSNGGKNVCQFRACIGRNFDWSEMDQKLERIKLLFIRRGWCVVVLDAMNWNDLRLFWFHSSGVSVGVWPH